MVLLDAKTTLDIPTNNDINLDDLYLYISDVFFTLTEKINSLAITFKIHFLSS